MKVRTLITALQACNPDADVVVPGGLCDQLAGQLIPGAFRQLSGHVGYFEQLPSTSQVSRDVSAVYLTPRLEDE